MAWEHKLAKMMKTTAPASSPVWFEGDVLSPQVVRDKDGNITKYVGPLVISCADGAIMLNRDRLMQRADDARYYAGQHVALLGDLFGSGAGAQNFLILGVIHRAI